MRESRWTWETMQEMKKAGEVDVKQWAGLNKVQITNYTKYRGKVGVQGKGSVSVGAGGWDS